MTTSRIGDYVSLDWSEEPADIAPLMNAIRFAIQRVRPVDFFLKGIFTGVGPSGGDPGWIIERRSGGPSGKQFWVYMSSDITYDDIDEAWYDEPTVKRHVRRTLNNFAVAHPDRAGEVAAAIDKYGL